MVEQASAQNCQITTTFYEQVHKIAQYLSALCTFEIWIKHHWKEHSTSICDYIKDFQC